MQRTHDTFVLARIPLDLLSAFGGWVLARQIRPITDGLPFVQSYFDPVFIPSWSDFLPLIAIYAVAYVIIVAVCGGYNFRPQPQTITTLSATIIWGLAIIAFFVLVYREPIGSRMMWVQALFFTFLLTTLGRLSIDYVKWQYGHKTSITLFGSQEQIIDMQHNLKRDDRFQIVQYVTNIHEINWAQVHEVWALDPHMSEEDEKLLREESFESHVDLRTVAKTSHDFARMHLEIIDGVPLLKTLPTALEGWGRVAKRLLDMIGAVLLIILLSPLLIAIAIIIKLTSSGPVFYGSKRVGKLGMPFKMWKFRSMVANADDIKSKLSQENHRQDGPFFKMRNDPRVTPVGRVLRRFSLDELPQLWNVLMGDMSLIGPRPHLPEEIAQLDSSLKRIQTIRPGLSGLAQVSGRSDLPFAEEMALDLYYVQNWSLLLDIKIFLKSIWVVLRGKGAD